MLLPVTIAAYCKNHTERMNILRGKNAELVEVKAGGKYSNHCVSEGK
jgi:hypothetical protein